MTAPYRTYAGQKAGLTRAVASGDPKRVEAECRRVIERDWTEGSPHTPYWPDDWSRWQRALEDAFPWGEAPQLFQ